MAPLAQAGARPEAASPGTGAVFHDREDFGPIFRVKVFVIMLDVSLFHDREGSDTAGSTKILRDHGQRRTWNDFFMIAKTF
jgi:hypothetical protein